jgi:hypothetical protein
VSDYYSRPLLYAGLADLHRMEYGTSYFGVRDVSHASADLDRFGEEGLNAVLHTFSERDQLYYEETVGDMVSASHERGFTVYVNPWGVGRTFGGEALSEFVGQYPDSCQRLSTGDRLPAACFNDDQFRSFMHEWVDAAVETGADVIFWDEPHWYIPEWHGDSFPDGAWGCRCRSCQSRFENTFGEEMPATQTDRVVDFLEDSLLKFLDEMMAHVHDAGAENAVCLLPGDTADHGLRDWERLAEKETLDVLASDPYWSWLETDVETYVDSVVDRVTTLAATHDCRSQIWIQGFRLDDSEATLAEVRTATRSAVDGGVDSVFMWGWDGCRVISDIACDDPESVWEAYLDELQSA